MDPLDHLEDLLDAHDGDDRCGCLRLAIVQLIAEPGNIDVVTRTISECLAEHPAGRTLRSTTADRLIEGDQPTS